mmetsp:Transcript_97538/g.244462  ORF Transcript_97538/g.244462 Transcript_97538/m.244462 type:complete len:257 (+) Transcript_97538:3740-4510(+)
MVFRSAESTSSTAERSLALASCSTRMTSQFNGTGKSREAMWRKMVVLPIPLGPRIPYLLPWTMVMEALSNNVWPGAVNVKFSQTKESPAAGGSFLPPSKEIVNAFIEPGASSSTFLYSGFFSKCFSCILFSLFDNFSPFRTFSNTTSIFSSREGSCSFSAVPAFPNFAARLSAASCLRLAKASSSVSSSSGKGSLWKSGTTKTRHVSKPTGGLGTETVRLCGSLHFFRRTSMISAAPPSTSGNAIASSGRTSQLPR